MNIKRNWQYLFSCTFLVAACLFFGQSEVQAQPESLFGEQGSSIPGLSDAKASKPKWAMKLVPEKAAAGDIVTAEITIRLDKKSYVYSQVPSAGTETKIKITQMSGLEAVDAKFTPSHKPKSVIEPLLNNAKLEKFYGGVTWRRKYKVTGTGDLKLKGTFVFQVCDEHSCNPFDEPVLMTGQLAMNQEPQGLKAIFGNDPETEKESPFASPANKPIVKSNAPTLELQQGIVLDSKEVEAYRESIGKNDPISFDVKLIEPGSEEGKIVVVAITATIEGDWHLYAQTQDPKMYGLPTVISVDDPPGFTPIDAGFLPVQAPEIIHPDGDETVTQHVFHHRATWQKRYRVENDTPLFVQGTLRYQMCNEEGCLPPNTVAFTLGDETAVATTGDSSNSTTSTAPIEESNKLIEDGLIPFLITGVIFGYLALLTPCVFPMIPITVSFFLKQAEKEKHNAVGMATLYCLGIIGTFTVIGLVVSIFYGGSGMTEVANLPWINIFIAAVLVFFGMNMLGLFEIRIPSSLLTWSSSKEQGGGIIGVLFMSFTFTLVSFTCTFAFVGSLLPMAAQGNYYWPVLGMLAFSTAFASPFFFLALFPSFLKKLPQSGGWMNRVKVTMGFIEIGAAFKFLSVADIGWFSVPFLFDYALVMTSWMVICIVTGIYLLGFFKLPHDSPSDSIGVIQLSFAMTFLGFAAYLASGIFGTKEPDGIIWQQVAAFAPPTFEVEEDVDLGRVLEHDGLVYALDVEQAIKYADAKNEPMFYDFTGVNCVNCRQMEKYVLSKDENRKLLEQFVRVQLYVDTVPTITDKTLSKKLVDKNKALQSEWFKSVTMPAYAVVSPDGKKILSSYKGKERVPGQFNRFLKAGLAEWQREKVAMNNSAVKR